MSERRFFDALMAESLAEAGEFVVYGVRLVAFNFRHGAILRAVGSPCWPPSREAGPAALLFAVRLCCAPAGLMPAAKVGEVERLEASGYAFAEQWESWCQYVRICAASPGCKAAMGQVGRVLNAPDELIVAAYLLQHTSLTEGRVWTMAQGLANWYVAAVKEQRAGKSDIVTEADEEEMAASASEAGEEEEAAQTQLFQRIEEAFTAEARAAKSPAEREAAVKRRKQRLRDFQRLDDETLEVQT